jgi:ABC-type nitrate/sulfonate/bicarbonate transport system substrate-binding protein
MACPSPRLIARGADARKARKSQDRSIRRRQSQRAPRIREQPKPKADKDRSGIFWQRKYRGLAVTLLAGVHVGCFELFAKEGIRSVADLKGRTVGIQALETSQHVFLSAMAALVGLNPVKDIEWVTSAPVKPIELFAEGKIDAFLGFPPEPQRLRAQNIGHVIVNSAQDRAWSQYFC